MTTAEHRAMRRAAYKARAERQRLAPPEVPPEKRCPPCGRVLPAASFGIARTRLDGLQSTCRTCAKDSEMRSLYGLDMAALLALWERAGRACPLCLRAIAFPSKGAHVDHCHVSGRIRGILCGSCNRALGWFRDDPAALRRAAEYVS